MTYDEWYQKYVKGNTKDRVGAKSIAKTIDSGIIKKNKDKLKMNLQLFAESDIKNQESGSLKRAIRKYEKRIKEHEEYLENPKAHCLIGTIKWHANRKAWSVTGKKKFEI